MRVPMLICGALTPVWAHSSPAQTAAQPAAVLYSQPSSTQPLPDELVRARLIWSMMIAVEQANQSGNYSVMRDIAAPDFQTQNDPAKLTAIFAGIRATDVDLSATLILSPTYTQTPAIDGKGMMHLVGGFGLRPTAIQFDLTFQWVTNRWKLYRVAVGARSIAWAQPNPGVSFKGGSAPRK
jgi:hypothetical protein